MGEGADSRAYGKYNAWCLHQPFRFDFPSKIGHIPAAEGADVRNAAFGISEDTMADRFFQGIQNRLCSFEVHICHPERKDIFRLSSFGSTVVFEGMGIFSVDDSIQCI
jgi:hypothetical protein